MMKKLTIVFLFFLFLQSCTAYYKTSIPIQHAVNKKGVKIIDQNGSVKKYEYLKLHEDSLYYGYNSIENTSKMKITKIRKPYDGYTIYPENRGKSIGLTLLTVNLVVCIPLLFLINKMECDSDPGFGKICIK